MTRAGQADRLGAIRRFVSRWPLLESFALRHHRLAPAKGQDYVDDLFEANPQLRSLGIAIQNCDMRGLRVLFTGVGPDLTRLALDLDILNMHWSPSRMIRDEIDNIAPQLRDVEILANRCQHTHRGPHHLSAEAIVARMTRLRKLTIAPCVIDDLSGTIRPLSHLNELAFVQSERERSFQDRARDLVTLLSRMSSLEQLSVTSRSWRRWNDADKAALENAARGQNVTLTII